MHNISRSEIERHIVNAAALSRAKPAQHNCRSFILGLLFFEESIRTQIGFQTAAYRLGGTCFTLKESKFQDNMSAAESLEDTVRVLADYADIVAVRHSDHLVFSRIAALCEKPMINCGNGNDEHPTQALIDLFAIQRTLDRLDDLKICIVGDLRHMRTAHSLLLGLAKFKNISVACIGPKALWMPEKFRTAFEQSCNKFVETEILNLTQADVVYMTGFAANNQAGTYSQTARTSYQLNVDTVKQLRREAIILCPLPRIDEITKEVDGLKAAKYFEQSALGQWMRMAILSELINNASLPKLVS